LAGSAKSWGCQKRDQGLMFAAHPFTTSIGRKDVRITTHYIRNPLESFKLNYALKQGMPYTSLGCRKSTRIQP